MQNPCSHFQDSSLEKTGLTCGGDRGSAIFNRIQKVSETKGRGKNNNIRVAREVLIINYQEVHTKKMDERKKY